MRQLHKTLNTLLEFRDKTGAAMLQTTGKWNWNGLSNIKDTSTESFRLQILVLYQSICI